MISYLVLSIGVLISGVAAWYSVVGLMAIFPAAAIPIAIMGGALEAGKILTASWLTQNWKRAPFFLKSYLTLAVVVLMLITSMGIFGFLSKANIDQSVVSTNVEIQIELYDLKVEEQRDIIARAQKDLQQLDDIIKTLVDAQRIRGVGGATDTKQIQKEQRDFLRESISEANSVIAKLETEKAKYRQQIVDFKAEIGPAIYLSEILYGESDSKEVIDKSVRWVIIAIIFVFDPLAVLLIVSATMDFNSRPTRKKRDGLEVVDVVDFEEEKPILPKRRKVAIKSKSNLEGFL